MAKVIADYFNTNLTGFRISREGNSIKTKLSLILRIIPTSFKNLLREIEFKSGIHKKRSKRLVTEVDNDLVQGQNILLIDDSIDTGHTIITALDFLKKFCGDNINIKVAALNKFKLSEELVTTDYYIYEDCIIIYPWSRDSKEYNNFLKLYNLK